MHVFEGQQGDFRRNTTPPLGTHNSARAGSNHEERQACGAPFSKADGAVCTSTFSVRTWNIAGADADSALEVIRDFKQTSLLAVQEWPRGPEGWRTVEAGAFKGLIFQSAAMCRGVAIFFDRTAFTATARKSSERGVWVKLVRGASGQHVWCGSLHLPHNCSLGDYETHVKEFLVLLPKKASRVVLLGDFNTRFRWALSGQGASPAQADGRWNFLKDATGQRGLMQVRPAPPDINVATFVSRKSGATATQIDGIFIEGIAHGELWVDKGSRNSLNSDHEQVNCACVLKYRASSSPLPRQQPKGGPRKLIKELPVIQEVTQQTLEDLARTCTSNKGGSRRFKAKSGFWGLWQSAVSCLRTGNDI